MIIDSHAHCDIRFGWRHTPDVLLGMMAEAGVDKACITTYADIPGDDARAYPRMLAALRTYPNQLVAGYLRLNPAYGKRARDRLVRAVREDGIRGLKIHPTSIILPPHSPEVIDVVRLAGELGVPTLFHSGDEPNALPLQIGKCAAACPDSAIIMGHAGGVFFWEDALRVGEQHANIYLEPSGNPLPDITRKAIAAVGAERVIFGTDMPAMHPRVERLKLETAELSEQERELVCAGNIMRLMHLEFAS
jgi:uncharacterized protein